MGKFLDPIDFPGLDEGKAIGLIEDAEALGMLVAPCLETGTLSDPKQAAVRAILRGVILRWSEAGSGVASQLTAGPFSQTITPQVRRNSFWPSEIKDLQKVCGRRGRAFAIDQAGPRPRRW